MKSDLETIAVWGAGAVGCYFGGMLARAGSRVTLIAREAHVEAIRAKGLYLDGVRLKEHIPIGADTDPAAIAGAGLVLFCVKTLDTESGAQALARHLKPGATVVSLQNGVDNVRRIRAAAGIGAVPAVVYVAASMAGPGHVRHAGRGDLVLGAGNESLAQLFETAQVPCRLAVSIEAELWTKLIMNCAYNAISALGEARYGHIARNPHTRELIVKATREVVVVAASIGVPLDGEAMVQAALDLAIPMDQAISSTAQDVERRKKTEIDSLNGYVAARGRELGIPTPVNEILHALVKLREEAGW